VLTIEGATVLVTGASRGLGREFARQCLARGAAKVYATARHPTELDVRGAHPLALDVTDGRSVSAAAAVATDVDVVINNAGIATGEHLVTGDLARIHAEFDVHFFGTLSVIRHFAPILARNGGGAILNVLSVAAFRVTRGHEAYSAAKAAQWALTNAARLELAAQGTQVTGVHLASADTDMAARWQPSTHPVAGVVAIALDGLQHGDDEVLADDETRWIKAHLADDPRALHSASPTP
jgi:NAD(P)-dependent dehydrogenase (short-subunit alcohol dehydrogenase family)